MNNSSFSNVLKVFGFIIIGLGLVAGALVLMKLSEGGVFSKGGVNPLAVIASVLVLFYHAVFGMLCLGVAALLDQLKKVVSLNANSGKSKKCPKCGKEYSSGFSGEFCEECGSGLA